MSSLFMYVVDRDFGFAPNPFHGICTLATCKPGIRRSALIGDWVAGIGGRRLKATGRCIFAMRVSQKITFNEYWSNPLFKDKRPIRNGSLVTLVGDNIYHHDGNNWIQEDSHHSFPDGSPDPSNVRNDTSANAVLVSDFFYYFGASAPEVPTEIIATLNYRNGRNYRRISLPNPGSMLLDWLSANFITNRVIDDPYQLSAGGSRYSAGTNRITT